MRHLCRGAASPSLLRRGVGGRGQRGGGGEPGSQGSHRYTKLMREPSLVIGRSAAGVLFTCGPALHPGPARDSGPSGTTTQGLISGASLCPYTILLFIRFFKSSPPPFYLGLSLPFPPLVTLLPTVPSLAILLCLPSIALLFMLVFHHFTLASSHHVVTAGGHIAPTSR